MSPMSLSAQIPTPTASCDDLCAKITGPFQGLANDLWWGVLFAAGVVLMFAVLRMFHAGATGNAKSMSLAKSAMFAVPLGLILMVIARIVGNWAAGAWS